MEPEQLWVLPRGIYSSETHFLPLMGSDVVAEFKDCSTDLFLLRKCLIMGGKEKKDLRLSSFKSKGTKSQYTYLKIGVRCG